MEAFQNMLALAANAGWVAAIAGGPLLFLVGLVFAVQVCADPNCHLIAKTVGFFFSLPFSYATGMLLAAVLLPGLLETWPYVAGLICLGYGWMLAWVLVAHFGKKDALAHLSERMPTRDRKPRTTPDRPKAAKRENEYRVRSKAGGDFRW